MANEPVKKKSEFVKLMFHRVAPRYDLLNRVISLGQDHLWKRDVIRSLGGALPCEDWILDLGTGTGDLAFEVLRQFPGVHVVACDLTLQMIKLGKNKRGGEKIFWVLADSANLPFSDGVFAGVVSGYLLRNVESIEVSLKEQRRVLRSGFRIAALDTTPPRNNLTHPIKILYLRRIIPWLGKWIAGDQSAYAYLARSTEQFLSAEGLSECFHEVGFSEVQFSRRMLGTIVICQGKK